MRKSNFLPRLYLPLLFVLCFTHAWRPLGGGFDFWAHAAVGRWIWNHGAVPHHGLFIWSAPNYPWIAHSWLSQLFFYGVISLGGPFLVMGLTVVIVCLSFGLIWRFWRQRGPISFVVPGLFALAIWCSAPRFHPRQEMLTALILVCLLAFLVAWREGRIGNDIETSHSVPMLEPASFGIVALFVLWINLHALVVTGLVLMVATAACDCLQYRFDRRSRTLLVITILCIAATLINPFGIKYWEAAAVLKQGSQAAFVDEWKPFWKIPLLDIKFVYGEAFLIFMAFVAWAGNRQRQWAQLFWLVLIGTMFVMQRRHLWLLALTSLMVMAANAKSFDMEAWWRIWRRVTKQPLLLGIPPAMRQLARVATVLILALWVGTMMQVFTDDKAEFWPPRAISRDAPVQVAETIKTRRLPDHIFNDYENSSYLQWSLNGIDPKTGQVPEKGLHPLFLDLLNAYPDHILSPDYFSILDANPKGIKMLDQLKINTVHLGPNHSGAGLILYLNHNRAWQKLSANQEGILWIRRKLLK